MESQFPVLCALKPGSEKFQRIPITTNVFKLGRGQHNTVVIPYKCLSKDHCLFKKVEGNWLLENCSYSNIKVNDNKLRKGKTHKLSDQDVIKLESSNELVYKFMSNTDTRSPMRKRRKLDENVQSDNNVKKTESTRSMRSDINKNLNDTQIKLKEQILSEQNKRDKEIYDDYAVRIEKLKGSKKNVKNQKALLKMRRNAQLELNKVKMEERIASVMAQQTNENKHFKDKPRKQNGQGDQRTSDQSEARREDRARMKEKRELKKLRRETRRLKLDKEKKLRELEKLKLRREKELQHELDKVNKKLAKERELHEKERRRAEQLLNQKKKELKKVSPSTSSDSKLDVESELQCSICSELFVRATTLGCSHSFCRYCIRKWTANKKECPICRAAITSECRSIVLDSLVDKMAESADAKKKRQELVKARDDLEAKEPTAASIRETQNYLFDPNFIRDFLQNVNSNSESSYHGRESSLEPDFDMLVPMDSDSEPSGFDDSDVFSGRDENGESEYDEPENYDENSEHGNEENYEGYSGESDRENEEIYDEAPEIEEEEHEGNSENDGLDDENYDEGENSPTENEDHDENDPEYNEGEESASENYDEGENSGPENYDEGEDSSPENYDEGENSAPENYDEGEISAPENYDEGDNTEPENYDEGENSGPENYDEGDNSAPENEGDYSAPEYDGDSYADDGGDDDDDDYY
ncbi:glutamic acid-rich protein-like [Cydia strobilella]|uniref:glutamic acid-rich protein-like n=1 Tax=Cydia strobilella TaxID=1100964 RepID=UPI00300453B2